MVLFTLVHHEDKDMRFYTWSVVSATISIFVSVMMFSSINELFHKTFFSFTDKVWVHVLIDLTEMAVYMTCMQIATAYCSGVLEEKPFQKGGTMTIKEQKEQKERRLMCWATLLAHMTGFAAINLGGSLQHGKVFQAHPPLTFLVVPAMYIAHIAAGRLFQYVRKYFIHGGAHAHYNGVVTSESLQTNEAENKLIEDGHTYLLHKYEETVVEAMNDVASLCVSFLFVQAIRFNISGVMPDNLGIEETLWRHDLHCSVWLGVLSVVFGVGSVCMAWINSPEGHHEGDFMSVVKRMLDVIQISLAMSMAWALLFVSKWEIGRNLADMIDPNDIVARVVMAVGISFVAFAVISILDKIADSPLTGDNADEAILQIINAIAILVGFSWEQAFDGGVEVLSAMTPQPVFVELVMAVCVAILVITPWRRYILHKVIILGEDRNKHRADDAKLEEPSGKSPSA
eukprot:CAMPEP_0117585778 /NCGR_PEP_ID=MMETSP0784-20121206/68344_1 /TAXON_ID=39447 /ORGANISM="" /LENGTH=455 /DNA_ID=CAMNT_0005386783 /DNA_START=69 /DNA_END=1436 /DNA_ORIENTATION=-